MALPLRFHSSPPVLARPVRFQRSRTVRPSKVVLVRAKGASGEAAVVWFKNDLRIDDHPGLIQAVEKHESVIPLYVFDPYILSDYSERKLELLLFALQDLKSALISQGSDLVLRLGACEDTLLKLVNEVKASHVFTEEEVEYNLLKVISTVESSLSNLNFARGKPEVAFWKAPLYDYKSLDELPTSYNNFLGKKLSKLTPVPAPTLPSLNAGLQTGSIPTIDEVKQFLIGNGSKSDCSWDSIKNVRAKNVLWSTKNTSMAPEVLRNKRNASSFFASEGSIDVRGGSDMTLGALAAYLRYLEGTGRDDWQELHDKLRRVETGNGTSFYTLFSSSLFLGTISRRRVFYEAIKYEKERNAGFISPFGYSAPTVTASVDAICSMEWYRLLALKSQTCNEGGYSIRIWRWNGHVIQYTAVGNDGPAILLVHGFGAFLQHYRDNIKEIADNGFRVWAITLLGFGKSEKPNVSYSEVMWAELLRDFIVDIINEPVHIVGNSLGGYISSIVAGVWPSLTKSLVLINTAGTVVPNYSFIPTSEEWRASFFSRLGARLLLLYLRSSAASILKSYYPTKRERVDTALVNEITRASYDPGAAMILESIFNFNLSIPLNFLLDSFGGSVLVIQGTKDPLVKSGVFLSMLREHCRHVLIKEFDAGHCVQDELPEEVNSILIEWAMENSEVNLAMKAV
ncbi:alpha/beta-Hydrolases superfamily protein [Rhynchospora pubera]|uniref:Alpha/beta-Hydrolases superfamily protein n=1 Tax=Rhynchospora pubera TaxID=906938 RepID=A0AAV8GJS3_9POAL|nr:alpha/beta-Hydrolases superfamily protein [Rhynchospora pubera]